MLGGSRGFQGRPLGYAFGSIDSRTLTNLVRVCVRVCVRVALASSSF